MRSSRCAPRTCYRRAFDVARWPREKSDVQNMLSVEDRFSEVECPECLHSWADGKHAVHFKKYFPTKGGGGRHTGSKSACSLVAYAAIGVHGKS